MINDIFGPRHSRKFSKTEEPTQINAH